MQEKRLVRTSTEEIPMRSLSRISLLSGLVALVLTGLSGPVARGQGNNKPEDVSFNTYDGVELKGSLYPNPGGKRKAVVILLHDFDSKKGGSSDKDNWPALAKALQADGYVVLAFDFRGFGKSTDIDATKFWNAAANKTYVKKGKGGATSINYKDFRSGYYPFLVNDIAAAKAYLDRLNDQKGCNTSSTIVIGAGQAATLGALWMANECRRKRDKGAAAVVPFAQPQLDDPECKDLAAGVWLTVSPTVEGRNLTGLGKWLVEAGQKNKVPMGFAFGKNDSKADTLSRSLANKIKSGRGEYKLTGVQPIAGTNLGGSKLLEKSLGTEKWIKDYLGLVMEARGNKEWRERESTKKAYYYAVGKNRPVINKRAGDEAPPVDLGGQFGFSGFPSIGR
jgi:pimeloyl-ACP methyl ester carboxylesterase